MIRVLAVLLATWLPSVAAAQPFCFCLQCILLPQESFFTSTTSMLPTLTTDTCFRANLTVGEAPVSPGQVVIFDHAIHPEGIVKRIVAVAGQTVQLVGGRLWIDGVPVKTVQVSDYRQSLAASSSGHVPTCPAPRLPGALHCKVPRLVEILPNGMSYYVLDLREGDYLDDTPKTVVPEGHVFVLGDNRDNSIDSRLAEAMGGLGFIPLGSITGVVSHPAASLDAVRGR